MLLGWAPKDNREMFTLEEFVKEFKKGGLQVSNPIFNVDKLDWFNGQYIRKKSDEELTTLLMDFAPKNASIDEVRKLTPLVKERIKKLSDFDALAGFYFKKAEDVEPLIGTANYLNNVSGALETLNGVEDWKLENINASLTALIGKMGVKVGEFYMDLRGTLTGSNQTPPINETIALMGKEETLKRLKRGVDKAKSK
jgi:glutamyl-tRNA synthetase